MFDQAIAELEIMGVPYMENEDGSLTIDISEADKTDVVDIVAFLNENGLDYTIDAETIEVTSLSMPEEEESLEAEPDLSGIGGDLEGMF